MWRLRTSSMHSVQTLLATACLVAACAAPPALAQDQPAQPHQKQYGPTPPPAEKLVVDKTHATPFAVTGDSGRGRTIEFRTLEQMTAQDKLVAANAESSIAENTHYTNLEFNQGSWSYEQVVCPALPEHVFLRFMRNNGAGDMSMFTASIPRGGEGRVRIIPIQLRGYSLFSPAPINAMTVAAFNKIRAEENPDHQPVSAWLGVGLCYAALAGGHPVLPSLEAEAVPGKAIAQDKGILQVEDGGGAAITYNDVSLPARTMTWTMDFDRNGKLVKASHSGAQSIPVVAEKPETVDVNPKAVAMAQPVMRAVPSQPSPPASAIHPVPPQQAVVMKPVPVPATQAGPTN